MFCDSWARRDISWPAHKRAWYIVIVRCWHMTTSCLSFPFSFYGWQCHQIKRCLFRGLMETRQQIRWWKDSISDDSFFSPWRIKSIGRKPRRKIKWKQRWGMINKSKTKPTNRKRDFKPLWQLLAQQPTFSGMILPSQRHLWWIWSIQLLSLWSPYSGSSTEPRAPSENARRPHILPQVKVRHLQKEFRKKVTTWGAG